MFLSYYCITLIAAISLYACDANADKFVAGQAL